MINHNNDKDSFNYSFWMARGCAGGDTGGKKRGWQVELVEPVGIRPDYSNNGQVIIHPHSLISREEPLCHSCFVLGLTKAPFWALNVAHLQRTAWFDAVKQSGGSTSTEQTLILFTFILWNMLLSWQTNHKSLHFNEVMQEVKHPTQS